MREPGHIWEYDNQTLIVEFDFVGGRVRLFVFEFDNETGISGQLIKELIFRQSVILINCACFNRVLDTEDRDRDWCIAHKRFDSSSQLAGIAGLKTLYDLRANLAALGKAFDLYKVAYLQQID